MSFKSEIVVLLFAMPKGLTKKIFKTLEAFKICCDNHYQMYLCDSNNSDKMQTKDI